MSRLRAYGFAFIIGIGAIYFGLLAGVDARAAAVGGGGKLTDPSVRAVPQANVANPKFFAGQHGEGRSVPPGSLVGPAGPIGGQVFCDLSHDGITVECGEQTFVLQTNQF